VRIQKKVEPMNGHTKYVVTDNPQLRALAKKMSNDMLLMASAVFPDHFFFEFGGVHYEWANDAASDKKRICEIVPRGHGKSTFWNMLYPAFSLAFTEHHHIVIASNTVEKAQQFLQDIRHEFNHNEILKAMFGNVEGESWGAQKISFKFFNTETQEYEYKIINIVAASQTKIRGMKYLHYRPDLVIIDDVENDEQVKSKMRRKQMREWFWSQVVPAVMDTDRSPIDDVITVCRPRIVAVGTILHKDSFLINIKEGYPENGWLMHFHMCVEEDEEDNRYSLWDEAFSVDYWDKKRLEYKHNGMETAFMLEYMNTVVAEDDMIIPIRHLKRYRLDELDTNGLKKYLSVDIASSKSSADRDYNALVVLGVHPDSGGIFVLDARRYKTNDINVMINEILSLGITWNVRKIVYERSGIQNIIEVPMRNEMRNRGTYLPLHGLTTSNISKEDRVRMTVAYNVGARRLSMPVDEHLQPDMIELLNEMSDFPNGKHDDMVDSLAMCIVGCDPKAATFKEYHGETRPASISAMWDKIKKEDRENRFFGGKTTRSGYNYID
jgi:phage terminase large subunit-like protein